MRFAEKKFCDLLAPHDGWVFGSESKGQLSEIKDKREFKNHKMFQRIRNDFGKKTSDDSDIFISKLSH